MLSCKKKKCCIFWHFNFFNFLNRYMDREQKSETFDFVQKECGQVCQNLWITRQKMFWKPSPDDWTARSRSLLGHQCAAAFKFDLSLYIDNNALLTTTVSFSLSLSIYLFLFSVPPRAIQRAAAGQDAGSKWNIKCNYRYGMKYFDDDDYVYYCTCYDRTTYG